MQIEFRISLDMSICSVFIPANDACRNSSVFGVSDIVLSFTSIPSSASVYDVFCLVFVAYPC